MSNKQEQKGLSRRDFLKTSGVTAATATVVGAAGIVNANPAEQEPTVLNAEIAAQKWSFEIPPDPIPDSEIAATVEADIIVIGAGVAGVVAAASAAENGASVVLITASSIPVYRGGSFHAGYSKYMEAQGIPRYDVDKFYRRELTAAGYDVDQTKWWKFYNNSEEAMNWLIDKMEAAGYETILEISNDDPEGLSEPMYQPPTSHGWISGEMRMAGMGADLVVNTLAESALAAGADIRYKVIAKQLVREDNNTGRVTAVIAQGEDSAYTKYVGTKAIILATGDYSTNREMLAKYCPKALPIMDDTGDQGYDNVFKFGGVMPGDGQKMGLWVGAAWQRTDPAAIMVLDGAPTDFPYGSHRGLVMNKNGVRYGNEYALFSFAALSLYHQPDLRGYAIWDANYAEANAPWYAFGMVRGAEPTPPADVIAGWEAQVDAGVMLKADTLEALVEAMGLPVETTLATIERYNGFCATGVDEDFHKQARFLHPIVQPPFYAATWKPQLLTVCGGLRTNLNMQVCDENDQPIPGLYNIGIMVGDFFGTMYTFRVEGHNLGANCLTFGYLTGRDIANGTLE